MNITDKVIFTFAAMMLSGIGIFGIIAGVRLTWWLINQ